ncbi:geranylgeranyl transferase type-2 subunit alpha 1 isoform X2 [Phalaenopsis equestris]|uniref:geranylgeranyl transferase type-2 subunit alpha 1 isoform X2 n=1 Tax=Phalaenopsis equestris TaxID=78828 RepID=UPI0009E3AD49|nr:geranylgeranyl transferase type-2 subunit alpha 1 isoform X2 [Phalaenopsis equestris]
MHGRPRKSPGVKDAAAAAAKASNLRDLQAQLIHNHHHRVYTKEAISASSKLLEINPEILTVWNYRKHAFLQNLKEATDSEGIKSLVDDELRAVEMALRANPKSYGAWFHRKWVLSQGLAAVDFDREFRLLDHLLKADSRNFHGWNYRSELLSRLLNKKAPGFVDRESILTKEYDLVSQALFTDPSDQSGWFYHLWLLDQTVTPNEVLLISSWPSHGSDWVLSVNGDATICKPSKPICTGYYFMNTGKLPIVLYFNQTVKGVNSSSVTVNSIFVKNENLVWRPLPPSKSQEAACWVTYLQIPDVLSDSKAYVVEVKLSHSKDILSSIGSEFNHPSHFRFTLTLNSESLENAGGESVDELLVWNDGRSSALESNDLVSFDQLNLCEDHASAFSQWQLATISNEIKLFKELSEENCIFVNLTLARLLLAQEVMVSHRTLTERLNHLREVLKLYDDLLKLDPRHAGYYEDERSLVLMNQVTCDEKSISSHRSHSSNYTSSKVHLLGCLQLKSLSLTRIGYVERLLWVQTLDLSHNKLRSIAGIEALQLLTCLNLRNNQICSITSLEPLKPLSYLRVLDISFNKIGLHPVDTTRYLFSSPLTYSMIKDEKYLEECRQANINVADNWEAIFLFRDLHLKQLDVKGNAVADEKFRALLKKVLPTLIWLDGERL